MELTSTCIYRTEKMHKWSIKLVDSLYVALLSSVSSLAAPVLPPRSMLCKQSLLYFLFNRVIRNSSVYLGKKKETVEVKPIHTKVFDPLINIGIFWKQSNYLWNHNHTITNWKDFFKASTWSHLGSYMDT
jgi:hypothetical protein